jgi:hypothetical protein
LGEHITERSLETHLVHHLIPHLVHSLAPHLVHHLRAWLQAGIQTCPSISLRSVSQLAPWWVYHKVHLHTTVGAIISAQSRSWSHTWRKVSYLEPYLAHSLSLGSILGAKSHTWSHTFRKFSHWDTCLAQGLTLGDMLGSRSHTWRHAWCKVSHLEICLAP